MAGEFRAMVILDLSSCTLGQVRVSRGQVTAAQGQEQSPCLGQGVPADFSTVIYLSVSIAQGLSGMREIGLFGQESHGGHWEAAKIQKRILHMSRYRLLSCLPVSGWNSHFFPELCLWSLCQHNSPMWRLVVHSPTSSMKCAPCRGGTEA